MLLYLSILIVQLKSINRKFSSLTQILLSALCKLLLLEHKLFMHAQMLARSLLYNAYCMRVNEYSRQSLALYSSYCFVHIIKLIILFQILKYLAYICFSMLALKSAHSLLLYNCLFTLNSAGILAMQGLQLAQAALNRYSSISYIYQSCCINCFSMPQLSSNYPSCISKLIDYIIQSFLSLSRQLAYYIRLSQRLGFCLLIAFQIIVFI